MSSNSEDDKFEWVSPFYVQLRGVAAVRHRRLPWLMDLGDVLHEALLRWAPGQTPPQPGYGLTDQQLATFSLKCRNVLLNELRSFTRRRKRLEELQRRSCLHEQDDGTVVFDNAEFVQNALSKLNKRERLVLKLRYFEQLEFEVIAQTVGCRSAASARQIHFRALEKLRSAE